MRTTAELRSRDILLQDTAYNPTRPLDRYADLHFML